PERFAAVAGAHAAAAVGRATGVPVWLVVGAGRVLPAALWGALEAQVQRSATAPWRRGVDLVPLASCDRIVGPDGCRPPGSSGTAGAFPVAPELLRPPG
ncbi:MAG: hypothetical protein ACRD03_16395, partial [Acidimicrobiales bacterium]